MTPEQAKFMLQTLLPQIEAEQKITRRIISAVPVDKGDYRPAARSRSALELAWHIAATEMWFLDSVAKGNFSPDEGDDMPTEIKNSADVVEWYDKHFAANLKRVEVLPEDHLSKPINFYNAYNYPAVFYLLFLLKHSIHHRGQLSAYLRPMGAKVPNIYGGSADEPFQAAAQA